VSKSCPTGQQIELDHDQVVPVANVGEPRVITGRLLLVGAGCGHRDDGAAARRAADRWAAPVDQAPGAAAFQVFPASRQLQSGATFTVQQSVRNRSFTEVAGCRAAPKRQIGPGRRPGAPIPPRPTGAVIGHTFGLVGRARTEGPTVAWTAQRRAGRRRPSPALSRTSRHVPGRGFGRGVESVAHGARPVRPALASPASSRLSVDKVSQTASRGRLGSLVGRSGLCSLQAEAVGTRGLRRRPAGGHGPPHVCRRRSMPPPSAGCSPRKASYPLSWNCAAGFLVSRPAPTRASA